MNSTTYIVIGIILLVGIYIWYIQKNKKKNPQQNQSSVPSYKPKYQKYIPIVVLLIVVIFGYWFYKTTQSPSEISITLSDAIKLSKSNSFSEMMVENKSGAGKLKLTVADKVEELAKDADGKEVTIKTNDVVAVDVGYMSLKELTDMGFVLPPEFDEDTTYSSGNSWYSYLTLGFLLLFLGYYAYQFKGNTQKFEKDKNSITFNDIGGASDIKDELKNVVKFLQDKQHFADVGAKIPRGVLLEGPPGVGKTMLARAIATEANVPFYYTTGSEFHTMWAGLAAQKVKRLFSQVKKTSGVIFIDEFDSVAHKRTMGTSDVGREWNHTLNQLLAEMDGFNPNTKVIVLAATNRADVLDDAALRPGRFDSKIYVPLPSLKDRVEILKIHSRGKPIDKGVDYESIARQTTGFSGADLALLMNEAAIATGKEHKNKITQENIFKSIDKVLVGGERKNLSLNEEEKKLLAYHEAGHALVATKLSEADKVQRVSIIPRGQAGGFTRTASEKEQLVVSKSKAMATISVLLGGRIAEEVALNSLTSGAQADLQRANEIAREMVEHWGMGHEFGLRFVSTNHIGMKEVSLEAQKVIESDMLKIFDECYKKSRELIESKRSLLDNLAQELLLRESLDAISVDRILADA